MKAALFLTTLVCGVTGAMSGGVVQADDRPNFAGEKELPSGAGLAAGFPGDAGIDAHPDVLFADGFESADFSGGWDERDEKKQGVFTFPEPDRADLGKRCLRVEATLGENTGGGPTKWFESAPTIHVRFYTKFAEDCDYVHHFVTLRANKGLHGIDKWSGFGGAGTKPDGISRFSTAIEPWGDWAKFPPPGKWNFYSYWPDMKVSGDGKYWGSSFLPDGPVIRRGEWICVEFMLRHNTPGKADGEQAFWIDGELRGHWKGIRWRESATLWANALTVETYITDRWTKQKTNVVLFDNVVIARKYIGPVEP